MQITASQDRPRALPGHRLRELRRRMGHNQAEMARRLGLSVSYLSQLENGDRPATAAVVLAFARAFPLEWAEVAPEEDAALLVGATQAAADPTVPGQPLPEDVLRRAARQQPLLTGRLIAIHAAYRRSQEQLAALDDAVAANGRETGRMPWEEVRDWFQETGNYIDALDRGAEGLRRTLDLGVGGLFETMRQRLGSHHEVTLVRGTPDSLGHALSAFEAGRRELAIDRSLPPESIAFLVAHQLVRLEMPEVIDQIAAEAAFKHPESRRILAVGLANYAAGALVMPYRRFREAARECRHDIDRLRQQFAISFEQACHRLSTLQRPGLQGVPFFFCRVDMAGNITKRHSATRLEFARFGGACPLWMVHEAAAIADRILVQLAELPEGERFVSMAKGLVKSTGSYLRPPRRYAVALGCEVAHAKDFVYADQLDLRGRTAATPIGISCRVCPRADCEQRAFPPAGRQIEIDLDRRDAVPYTFA